MPLPIRILFAALLTCACGSASAETRDKSREITLGYGSPPPSLGNRAPKPTVERVNPCAAYGPGFQPVAGTASCIKMSGGVRVDTGTTRKLH